MKKPKDCYLVVKYDEEKKADVIAPLCVKCGSTTEESMFWPGARGYSAALWQCSDCGQLIYDGREAGE